MANKRQNKLKVNNKQKIKNKLTSTQKRKFEIIGFSCSIVLLVLILIGILKINTKVKSETKDIMNEFNKYYSSEKMKVIYYYDSTSSDENIEGYELSYIIQISKDYKIDYLAIDMSLLNNKNREEIETSLGIRGISPTTVLVKNEKVVAVQEGFIESHNLVQLFIDAGLLDKDAKFSQIDNLKFINYEEYLDIFKSKDKHVVIIGQAACQYCISIKPIVNNISKAYKIDINYLDVTDLSSDEVKELFEEMPNLGYDNEELVEEQLFSMPTMLLVDDGKIISYLSDARSLEEYVNYLKENNFIE